MAQVLGVQQVKARINRIIPAVVAAARAEMEAVATQIVSQMAGLKPLPNIIVDWTWGAPPKGSVTLGRVAKSGAARMRITIFATATTKEYPQGFPAIARWFEFGTAVRYRTTTQGAETGRISAQPYFFPVYRANRRRARTRISRAIRKAAKEVT